MIPSFNIKETSNFFKDILGFTSVMEEPTYVVLVKDNLTIHLLRAGTDIGQMEFYMEVDRIGELWENIKDKLQGIKVKEPFDSEYGMREVHIAVPQTNTLLFMGEVLARQS